MLEKAGRCAANQHWIHGMAGLWNLRLEAYPA